MLRRAVTRVSMRALRPRHAAPLRRVLPVHAHVLPAVANVMDVAHVRSAHSASKKKKDTSLVALLEREVEEEKGNCLEADELHILQEKITKDFDIKEKPGNMDVVLEGKVNGNTVRIRFDAQDVLDMYENFEDEEEGEEEDDAAEDQSDKEEGVNGDYEGEHDDDCCPDELPGIRATVDIARGKQGLQFECVAGGNITIDRVRFLEDFKDAEGDEALYSGPEFDQLEPDLQDAFYKYLEDHKVDDDMAQFITEFADLKEQREYLAFLEQSFKFISK